MKKIISLIVAVAIIASMFVMTVPASAATGKIEMPSVVETDVNGNFSFKVKVWGANYYEAWLGMYNKEMLEMVKNPDGTYDFDLVGHFGRIFIQPSNSSNGDDLKKDYVAKDGTEILMSNETINWRSHPAFVNGEYTMFLFKYFNDGGYEILAQKDFTVTGGYQTFTKSAMKLSQVTTGTNPGDPSGLEDWIWLKTTDAYVSTDFTASGEFDALGFTAWSSSITDDELKKDVDWVFEIIDFNTDEVVVTESRKVPQDKFQTLKFDPLPAGEYTFRVSAAEGSEMGAEPNLKYLVLPVSELLPDADAYSTSEGCEGIGTTLFDAGSAVGFGIHLTGKDGDGTTTEPSEEPTPGETEDPTPGETEEPTTEETEEPTTEETEEPTTEETEAPSATDAPEVTDGGSNKTGKDGSGKAKDEGLGMGAIIGIIAGGVVILAGAGVAIYFLVIKKKK